MSPETMCYSVRIILRLSYELYKLWKQSFSSVIDLPMTDIGRLDQRHRSTRFYHNGQVGFVRHNDIISTRQSSPTAFHWHHHPRPANQRSMSARSSSSIGSQLPHPPRETYTFNNTKNDSSSRIGMKLYFDNVAFTIAELTDIINHICCRLSLNSCLY